MTELRALTVRQPWAGCIAHLGKRIENRTWRLPDRHHGTQVAIHAAVAVEPQQAIFTPPESDFETLFASTAEWDAWRFWHLGRKPCDTVNWPPKLALGAVVAVATLAGCHHFDYEELCGYSGDWSETSRHPGLCSPWAQPGVPWHWQLADIRPLVEPVPCKGALGLWRLPEDVEKAVREQLEGNGNA